MTEFSKYSPEVNMDALSSILASLSTDEAKLAAINMLCESRGNNEPRIHAIRPDASNSEDRQERESFEQFFGMLQRYGMEEAYAEHLQKAHGKFADAVVDPLKRLPCANVNTRRRFACSESGTKICASCKLVSYCSKKCQKEHWQSHKQDCKGPLADPNWQPGWITEHREPAFVSWRTMGGWSNHPTFGLNMHLWGNVPAASVLNLPKNEGSDVQQDLSLAFVASGDLRNVVKSVNELPDDYKGHLTIVINDHSPFISLRNLVLLLIFAKIPDSNKAAELALHVWYSLCLPEHSYLALIHMLQEILVGSGALEKSKFEIEFVGGKSKLNCEVGREVMFVLAQTLASGMDISDAANEWAEVMLTPSRVDYRHRYLSRLNPSHRVAYQKYRDFGLVLPFGAANAHFNVPNPFLFSPDGSWLQNDSALPLDAWNIDDVLASGKAHGATSEDLFGCLYFHLSEQLSQFADRIRRLNVTIHLTSLDAVELSQKISTDHFADGGLPASNKFDRVDVSNILDAEYLGFRPVLRAWGKMLNPENKHSNLCGYSMRWRMNRPDLSPETEAEQLREIAARGISEGKLKKPTTFSEAQCFLFTVHVIGQALRPNGTDFRRYLRRHNVEKIARDSGLVLKSAHSVNPHRIGADIDAGFTGLPQFPDQESFYRQANVSGVTFLERYMEFKRA